MYPLLPASGRLQSDGRCRASVQHRVHRTMETVTPGGTKALGGG